MTTALPQRDSHELLLLMAKAATTLALALEKIAANAPVEDPGNGEWINADTAFACGLDAAHFEQAEIARKALAEVKAMNIGIAP